MTARDFKRAVSEADAALEQVSMPLAAVARLRRRLDRPGPSFRRMSVALLALATAGAGAWLAARSPVRPDSASPHLDGFETISRSPDLQLWVDTRLGTLRVERGSCTLRVRGWGSVALRAGSWLGRADGGLELSRGAAEFQVDKRAPGTGSTFVRGPQGSIEITGTRFSVIQGERGGSVHLDEGAIRFRSPDGRTVALVPGQSLAWPLPAPDPAPLAAPPGGGSAVRAPVVETGPGVRQAGSKPVPARPRDSAALPEDSRSLVERIAALRAEGRYEELAEELSAATDRERRPLTRERLSFELGAVLTYHLEGGARACAHWAAHDRAFPGGHYAQEVSDARKRLHCDETGGVE